MIRRVRLREDLSGLDVRLELIDDLAPRNSEALWQIAGVDRSHEAIHAMWTGPEISCPVIEDSFPKGGAFIDIPIENATSFPTRGEVATVFAHRGTWKGLPPTNLFDIGLFYGDGARLLMPMGWVMASVCARVVDSDLDIFRQSCRAIRSKGACQLIFSRLG